MKFATFEDGARAPKLGLVHSDRLLQDLTGDGRDPDFSSLQALIEAGQRGLDKAHDAAQKPGDLMNVADVRLLAPLPRPQQIRDFMCFETHVRQSIRSIVRLRAMAAGEDPERALETAEAAGQLEVPAVWYERPVYYKANRFAVGHPGDTVTWPVYSRLMDYECELACIIGQGGRDIRKDDAREHIFGYTIFNDLSARDAQSAEMGGQLGPAKGKDFDKANIFGPWVVTADEFDPAQGHAMRVFVNGEQRSEGNSKDMHWGFADLIAYVSQSESLHPGEILGSGTVGNGCGLELMRFLENGDEITLEIDGIGRLTNRVEMAV